MVIFKDILHLLSIFIIYGIAGRMDYEEAVRLEQIRMEWERLYADCPAMRPEGTDTQVRIADQDFAAPSESHRESRVPCFWPEP